MMGLEYIMYITGSADGKDGGELVVGSGMYLFGMYIVQFAGGSLSWPR